MDTRKQPNQTGSAIPGDFEAAKRSEPHWWNTQHGSRWDRVKEAFRHAWASTKAEFTTSMDPDRKAALDPEVDASSEKTAPAEVTHFPPHERHTSPADGGAGRAGDSFHTAITQPNGMKAITQPNGLRQDWIATERDARYGYGAHSQYSQFTDWTPALENTLRGEWMQLNPGKSWDEARERVRRGWEFSQQQRH